VKVHLSDSTITEATHRLNGDARQLDDGSWLPLVRIPGEWADPRLSEPSCDTRIEAIARSRALNIARAALEGGGA